MYGSSYQKSGFTLIELIVVMAVTATLSIIGVAAFVNFSHTQEINAAQRDIVTMLETAKFRAQSQAIPPTITGLCASLSYPRSGYSVDFTFSSGTYSLFDHCSVGNSPATDTEDTTAVQTKKLSTVTPVAISFSPTFTGDSTAKAGDATIFFPILTGGRGLSSDPPSITITISGYGLTKTITVYNDGRIYAQ